MSKKRFGGHKAQQPGGGLSRVLLSEAFCGIDVLSHNFRRHFLDVLCVLYCVNTVKTVKALLRLCPRQEGEKQNHYSFPVRRCGFSKFPISHFHSRGDSSSVDGLSLCLAVWWNSKPWQVDLNGFLTCVHIILSLP